VIRVRSGRRNKRNRRERETRVLEFCRNRRNTNTNRDKTREGKTGQDKIRNQSKSAMSYDEKSFSTLTSHDWLFQRTSQVLSPILKPPSLYPNPSLLFPSYTHSPLLYSSSLNLPLQTHNPNLNFTSHMQIKHQHQIKRTIYKELTGFLI